MVLMSRDFLSVRLIHIPIHNPKPILDNQGLPAYGGEILLCRKLINVD
jgi:hypothetical protein